MSIEVVVIGGGFAGLSAATALAERGARVTVLEARPTLGGRATAFTDPATGERVDNGQHVLIGCYHETFRFLRRIGAESNVDLQSKLAIRIVERDGAGSRLVCPSLPAPFHLIAGVLRWNALTWRDRLAVLRVRAAMRGRAGIPRGDRVDSPYEPTVLEWLLRLGQTPRLIALLWEPLAVAALNQPIAVASAAPFLEVLRRMFSSDARDSALGMPRVPLDELYAAPARAFIERHGGVVRTDAPARVVAAPDGSLRVRVRDEELHAASIVCAVAWHSMPEVLPASAALEPIVEAARRTAASPIVTVNLWYDREVSVDPFVGLPGRHMQWLFDKQRLFGPGSSHLSLVSSGAEAIASRSNRELIDLATAEVAEALPAARAAALRRAVVVREKRATFSLAPGQPRRPGTLTAIPGLLLAGDWIDTGLPATIESAVISGHWAAGAIIRQ